MKCNCTDPTVMRHTPNGPGSVTCAYYPPVYDGSGNNLNPDRNVTTQGWRCLTCGAVWTEKNGRDVLLDGRGHQ